jgi:sugar phosphate isomerase/epimerase
MLRRLLHDATDVGAAHIVLPIPPSSVDSDEAIDKLSRSLETSLPHAERLGVQICVEVAGVPQLLQRLFARLDHGAFRLCYDTGSALSRDAELRKDVEPLRAHLALVALSRPAVDPSTHSPRRHPPNYEAFFRSLLEARFSGPFILRHKFDRPETEAVQAVTQIREWISSTHGGTAPQAASPLAQSDAPRRSL